MFAIVHLMYRKSTLITQYKEEFSEFTAAYDGIFMGFSNCFHRMYYKWNFENKMEIVATEHINFTYSERFCLTNNHICKFYGIFLLKPDGFCIHSSFISHIGT